MTTDALRVDLPDGRILRAFDDRGSRGRDAADLTVVWHHGSPHTGSLLPPLLDAARQRRIRLVTYARPAYGDSTPLPGRGVASAAADVTAVADALGLGTFAVMGASGGGPHALACAALLPDRVAAAACFASPAPCTEDFDWFAGMASPAALRAARIGRQARADVADEFDPAVFVPADWAALDGAWASLGEDAGRAAELGPDGLVDDDVAFAAAWGFDLADVRVPTLLVHGVHDRMVPVSHAEALGRAVADAELWLRPDDGHVSVLSAYPAALDWLIEHARR